MMEEKRGKKQIIQLKQLFAKVGKMHLLGSGQLMGNFPEISRPKLFLGPS